MKRFRSAVLLLSALIATPFAFAAPPVSGGAPERLYNAAMVAAKAGKYARAISLCRETLALSPRAAPVWASLARLLSGQQRHTDAVVAAQKAVALAPKYAPFHADLADFYRRAENPVAAKTSARKALSIDPKNDVALTTLATCLLGEGRYKEAVPLLERLQAGRGGTDRGVSETTLSAYLRSGDRAAALRSAKRFASKTPTQSESLISVIYLALDTGDRATAQNYIARLQKIAPKSPQPDYFRGRLALTDTTKLPGERLRNAEGFFQKAADRSPQESLLRAQLGYAQLGQSTKEKLVAARANLSAAVMYSNTDPVARRGLALVAEEERNWEDAATQYEAVLKLSPQDNDSRRRYAGVLLYLKRRDDAYRQLYTLASNLPRDTRYLKELASFFVQDKQFAKARGAYGQALERDPRDVEALLGVAQSYVSEGNKKAARDAFERTLKSDPKQETAYLLLSQLYTDDGADDESFKTLERLIAAVPDSNKGRWQLIERHISRKEDDKALAEIAKLTLKAGDPARNRYRLATGNIHVARGRFADAVSEFERLFAEEVENPEFALALADAYAKADRKSDADTQYAITGRLAEAALRKIPEDRPARDVLTAVRKAQNNPDAAVKFLNEIDEAAKRRDGVK